MKIFLGWSGDESRAVAVALKDWLRAVCNAFEPWMSDMIAKGTRWSPAIAAELQASKAGVFTLTPDNLASGWLHFEAGAISNVKDARVCTFLRRVDRATVPEPLAAFQHTRSDDRVDTLEMVKALWRQMPADESKVSEVELLKYFDRWWPDLEGQLAEIRPPEDGAAPPIPTVELMAGQTLKLVRELVDRDRERAAAEIEQRRIADAKMAAARRYGLADQQLTALADAGHLGTSIADLLRRSIETQDPPLPLREEIRNAASPSPPPSPASASE